MPWKVSARAYASASEVLGGFLLDFYRNANYYCRIALTRGPPGDVNAGGACPTTCLTALGILAFEKIVKGSVHVC